MAGRNMPEKNNMDGKTNAHNPVFLLALYDDMFLPI